jgi:Pectate lyase superfamily protein
MTVPATPRRAGPFNGNDSATSFPFTFKVSAKEDIQVELTDVGAVIIPLVLDSDYSVTLNGDQDASPGGSVTYPISGDPLATGEKLVVLGALANAQLTDLPAGGAYRAKVVEDALDRQVILIQQLAELLSRALTLPATAATADTTLPAPESDKLIGWNTAGTALVNLNASVLASIVAFGTAVANFTLSANPGALANLDVSVAGVTMLPTTDYTWSGTTITFVAAPANLAKILVRYIQALPQGTTDSGASTFTHSGTYANGTVGRALQHTLNVMNAPYNAKGDGITDDTAAIQAAITDAQNLAGAEVYFPPRLTGAYYKVTSPLVISSPVRLRGAGAYAVQLIAPAGAIASGNYILDINCLAANNVEHITIEGLTVRSLDSVPNGIRIKNAAYSALTDVRVFAVANGLDFDGTRCFSNTFERFICYGVTGTSVRFLSTFAGGGQFVFRSSTFVGAYGVQAPAGALTENVVFEGCNWEGCTTRAVLVNGTAQGWTFISPRGEAGTGHGFEFAPTSSHECTGLVIHGMSYYSGTVAARPITLGTAAGTGGRVRGFSITGCRIGYAGQDYFCVLHAEVQSGVIAGNHFAETTTAAISAPRAGVLVTGNENASGRLPEYNGLNLVEQGTFTATATGLTTSPTGTCKYVVNDGAVTLDIPGITGTSNATSFTLTGAPVAVRPAVDKDVLCRVQDNSGAVGLGLLRMKTTGVLELYVGAAGAAFTASGTKAVAAMSVSYTL